MKILHNYVLIQIRGQYFEKARGLYVANGFHPESHACVYGTVKQVPEKLLYFKHEIDEIKKEFGGTQHCPLHRMREIQELTARSVLYEVPIELKVSDFVFYSYNVYAQAAAHGRIFEKGEEMYILIPYDMCFVAIREDEIIPLNGLVLLEPVIKKYEGKLIVEEEEHATVGTIAHLGTKVKSYLQYSEESDTDDFFQVGDKVLHRKFRNVPLEWSTHRKLNRPFTRLHRKDILAKLEV